MPEPMTEAEEKELQKQLMRLRSDRLRAIAIDMRAEADLLEARAANPDDTSRPKGNCGAIGCVLFGL